MANYCDSAELERNWLRWLMASRTPSLEPLRGLGILWSRPVEYVREGSREYPSPVSKRWLHCAALGSPFFFASDSGVLCHHPDEPVNEHGLVPDVSWLGLDSGHPCLALDNPFYVRYELVPRLTREGYIHERPVNESWRLVIRDVENTCQGVARKFKMTEEDRADMVQEAVTQLIRKLRQEKLVYRPGKAPVFNLLTTTIHRCMYSVLNKSCRTRRSNGKLISDLRAGIVPKQYRSFRIPEIVARYH